MGTHYQLETGIGCFIAATNSVSHWCSQCLGMFDTRKMLHIYALLTDRSDLM